MAMEASLSPVPTLEDEMAAQGTRPMRMMVFGDFGSGKTRYLLELFVYLSDLGLKPEDLKVLLIDCDNGTMPLVHGGIVERQWFKSIQHAKCRSFDEAVMRTKEFLPVLEAWQKVHGYNTAWILVDNLKFVYEELQDAYSQKVYGISAIELAQKRRQEAQTNAKTGFALFSPMHDWSIIGRRHNIWTDLIYNSTVNFIWATPEKHFTKMDKDAKGAYTVEVERAYPGGQPDNRGKADEVIRLWVSVDDNMKSPNYGKRVFYADLLKSRNITVPSHWFMGAENPSFPKIMQWYAWKTKVIEEERAKAKAEAEAKAKGGK
jgi:hypothetical protein